MELILSTFVEGTPVPQGQMIPRMTCKQRGGTGCKAWLSPPDKQKWKDWRMKMTAVILIKLREEGYVREEGRGYHASMSFYIPRPKSHLRKTGELRAKAPEFPLVKPDVDNLVKSVNDSLTRSGIWGDDSELLGCRIYKRYCDPGQKPGVSIAVWRQDV